MLADEAAAKSSACAAAVAIEMLTDADVVAEPHATDVLGRLFADAVAVMNPSDCADTW